MKWTHKILFFITQLICFTSHLHAVRAQGSASTHEAEWTVMIYAQADSILNSFAMKNFQAMSTVGSNENLNIVVQWNQPKKRGIWRYKIEKNKMDIVDAQPRARRPKFAEDLVDFVRFTTKNYPARKHALILWNHGLGIMDPEWNKLQQYSVNPAALNRTPRAQIDGITKGILFDIPNRTYLNNQGLTHALSEATKIIGKKFELLGMDACLMSMLEVHYQVKDFAKFLVSSEEVELAQGWHYKLFLDLLANNEVEGEDLAKSIVSTFEHFYRKKTKFYTQSATNLSSIEAIKQNLDDTVNALSLCKEIDADNTKRLIQRARQASFELSVSCYVDLLSLYAELKKQASVLERESRGNVRKKTLVDSDAFVALKELLNQGIILINNTIIANVASPYLCRARGLSIYYPQKQIDPSYIKTEFAQEGLWLSFLQSVQ